MQLTKAYLISIVLALLSVPKGISAQDVLNSNDRTIQNSLLNLLSTPTTSQRSVSASASGRPPDPTPVSTHERFATFLAGEDFKSTLLLENFRPDLPITFNPTLMLSNGDLSLDSVTVPAHSSTTVDISAILKARSIPDKRGTISIRFDFSSYGPGSAVVQMRDDTHHLFLNSYAQSPEEYWSGTGYDAVVWAPHEGTEGFISITNASTETHAVRVVFLTKGRSEQQPQVQIPARQTRIIPIDDLLAQNRKSGAGIHIEYGEGAGEQYPGEILVEGQLFNKKTGFAKNIHFMDKALPPTGTLRTHFLMLGHQPVEDNFPSDVSFRSVAAVRNIDSVTVTVTPTVKFLRNEGLQSVSLPSRSLRPAESILIDFNEEQKAGHLPPDFNQGSLELTPDTDRTSIVGELFNFSQSGGYVVGPSFSSYPTRSTSSIWRTDGSFQTTIVIENTAAENDRVAVQLYSEQSQYRKTYEVAAGTLLKINVRDLQQNEVPDDQGNLLLDSSGVLSLIGGHNVHSRLAYEKIVHSADESDYVGLPPSPCDYVYQINMWIDTSSGSQPFPVMKTYWWGAGPENSIVSYSVSSDTSLAQISNNGSGDKVTFTPPNDGLTHTVSIGPSIPQEVVEFCSACSFGNVSVLAAVLSLSIHETFYGPPVTETPLGLCFWGSLACSPGTTPTCTQGRGIQFSGTCPPYVQFNWLVVGGSCILPGFVFAATGPGPCN